MSAETRKTETIPEWKREEVDAIVDILNSYDSVGVVDVTGIPSKQLQDMRREIHGSAQLRLARNTLLQRALSAADADLADLTEHVTGHVGLIGTNDNPFGLFQQLEASKTPAPINAGEVAPNDIVIPEGDTGIDPGPFVGELQNVGANARIEDGSIQVLEDSTVLEAGGTVSADLENVLSELGIEPKEVGLDLRAVVADGVLFEPEELDIDVEAYADDLRAAAGQARNLALNAEVATDRTATPLVQQARGQAKSLALQAAIEDPEVVDDLVGKADAQVRALAAQVDDEAALPEDLRDVAAATPDQADAEAASAEDGEDATDATDADDGSDEEAAEAQSSDDDDDDAGDALGEMF